MLEDCEIKLSRAKKHVAELADIFAQHEKGYPPKFKATYSAEGSLSNLDVNVTSYPKSASAPLGDAIHNLRTALDIIAVALVERNGGSTKGVYFPFAMSEAHLEGMIKSKHFDRAGSAAVAALMAVKPYAGGNADLRGLHDLDIQDKHHAIIPVAVMSQTPPVEVFDADVGIPKIRLVPGGVPTVSPTFPPGGPFEGELVIPTLVRLGALVTEVVNMLDQSVPITAVAAS